METTTPVSGVTPPAVTPTVTPPPIETPPGDPAALLAELQTTRAALTAANAESASRRHKLTEYERLQATAQAATQTTEQRLTAAETARQAAEEALKGARLQIAFGAAVRTAKLTFANERAAQDAYHLADLSQALIAEDGTVTGLDPAIAALKTERAYLFAAPPPPPATEAAKSGAGNQKPSEAEKAEFAAIYGVDPKFL